MTIKKKSVVNVINSPKLGQGHTVIGPACPITLCQMKAFEK